MKQGDYDILRPEAESLLQSSRSFGYTVETAIADLIDNCIAAAATNVKISYAIDRNSSYIRIEDDGRGMDEKELVNAMKIGSFNPLDVRGENDLGRFGLGLKTASFSQCRRLTVKTRNISGAIFVRCWDLDIVAKEKDWVLLRNSVDEHSEKNLSSFSSNGSGTIVLWEKLDRLVQYEEAKVDQEHFYRKFNNVRKHLGMTFHRFIEDNEIQISLLDDPLEAINPFNISEDFPSSELSEEQLSINGHSILIQPYILPHESKLTGGARNNLEIIRGWTEHQGLYIYRGKRLIADGTWLDLEFRKKESQRLCRIKIDLPNSLDVEWQIDLKKGSAKIPDSIRKRIKDICFAAIEKAIKVYTYRGAYLRRKGQKNEIIYLWKARQKHGKRFYEINTGHPIYQLIAEYLSRDAYIFYDYIKLVGESLPISLIVSDFSDPSMTMKDFFEGSKSDLMSIFKNTVTALINAGFTEKDALEKTSKLECFQQLNIN